MIYRYNYFKFLLMLNKEIEDSYKNNNSYYVHFWPYHLINTKTFRIKTTYLNKIKPLRIQLYDIYSINDIIEILNSFGLVSIDDILEKIIDEYLKCYPLHEELCNIEYLLLNAKTQIEEYATQTIWYAIDYSLKVKKVNEKLQKRFFVKLKNRNIVGSHCFIDDLNSLNYQTIKSSNKLAELETINDGYNLFTLNLPCFNRKNNSNNQTGEFTPSDRKCQNIIDYNDCPCFDRKIIVTPKKK